MALKIIASIAAMLLLCLSPILLLYFFSDTMIATVQVRDNKITKMQIGRFSLVPSDIIGAVRNTTLDMNVYSGDMLVCSKTVYNVTSDIYKIQCKLKNATRGDSLLVRMVLSDSGKELDKEEQNVNW
jgi:hypothetical protein